MIGCCWTTNFAIDSYRPTWETLQLKVCHIFSLGCWSCLSYLGGKLASAGGVMARQSNRLGLELNPIGLCVFIHRLIFLFRGIPWSQRTGGFESQIVCQVCTDEALWVTGCLGAGEGSSMSKPCRGKRGSVLRSPRHPPFQHRRCSYGKHLQPFET